MNFDWFPILKWLNGKRFPLDCSIGQVKELGVYLELYDGKIFCFPDQQTRHVITLTDAKALYQKRQIQPTLFEM